MNLCYIKDEHNKDILINKTDNEQVMMEWEKPYMEACIKALEPKGDVLEIGFGLGYSARALCSYPIQSYTVIECEPIVWDKVIECQKDYPHIKINLVKGRWQEMLPTLPTFDTIFFDDFPYKEYLELDNYPKQDRVRRFISQCIQNHMNIGCKLSYYSSWPQNHDSYDCIEGSLSDFEIQIPENCNYIPYKKVYIPLLTKISEPSENDLDVLSNL